LVERGAGEHRRQLDLEGEHARGVGGAARRRQRVQGDVEGLGGHADAAALDRAAEEVVRVHGAAHRLARAVERLQALDLDLELRQHVPLHRDGLLRDGGLTPPHSDPVLALVDLVGEREVRRDDAVPRARRAAAEHTVAAAVLDLDREGLVDDRVQVGGAQGQRADVDDLSGLVERLVGRHEDPQVGRHVDAALEAPRGAALLGHDGDEQRADRHLGDDETWRHDAGVVGVALPEGARPARDRRLDPDARARRRIEGAQIPCLQDLDARADVRADGPAGRHDELGVETEQRGPPDGPRSLLAGGARDHEEREHHPHRGLGTHGTSLRL
jgi:hypothetical protein